MSWDIDQYAKIWEFVTLKHMGQTYGGRHSGEQIPYINHLASVATEVLWGMTAAPQMNLDLALQCALLHDVIEDTETSFATVQNTFGNAVAVGVLALTKDKKLLSRTEQMADSLQRIRQQPQEIWMVKMADRISNLYHPPFYWNIDKIEQYRIESLSILEALGSSNAQLAKRLTEKIAAYGKTETGTP